MGGGRLPAINSTAGQPYDMARLATLLTMPSLAQALQLTSLSLLHWQ